MFGKCVFVWGVHFKQGPLLAGVKCILNGELGPVYCTVQYIEVRCAAQSSVQYSV